MENNESEIGEEIVKNRRGFIQTTLAGTAGLIFSRYSGISAAATQSVDSRVEILLDESIGTISPNLYGHFTEHLGGTIYDGVWVGAKSKVPNFDGIRKDLVDQMRKIKAPVVRYPGGCFADSYDWRDGIGPSEKRPRRTNFWLEAENDKSPANHKYDPNEFGTNEFVHFCKLIGAEPYLAANVRSLAASEFYRWVEYCNSPAGSTTLAEERAKAGSAQPYNVRYWGVGNESWGCGGNFTPQEYAVEFRRYSAWLPHYGQPLSLIASGPNSNDWGWTRGFFEEIVRKGPSQLGGIYGWGLHHYAWNLSRGRTNDWEKGKGDAIQFDPVDWYEILREGERVEDLILGHWQVMSEFDHEHHVKLVVDEWGPWYRPGSEATPGDILEQTPTLRDAVFSGMTLDIFNRHAGKLHMANCAQLINCLNSLYLAHEDRFVITPVGHVFEMYAGHQGGESRRTIFSAPSVQYDRDGKPATFWGLQGSASLRGKDLLVTVVNPHTTQAREAEIAIRGGSASSAMATTLSHSDIHARNTFDNREAVIPQKKESLVRNGVVVHTFPAASVTALSIHLT
jgi:alpha-N-arabinofuranosidase